MDNQGNKTLKLGSYVLAGWAVTALLVWNFRSLQFDDAYITYRYARHISAGLGFSYNPPQSVLGTTTPLYTLLLAMFAWLGMDIPTISLILGGLGLAGMTWILLSAGREGDRTLTSFLPAIFLILIPGSYLILGMETALYTALLHFGLYFASRRKFTAAIVFASAATLARYDGIAAAGVILLSEWYFTQRAPEKNGMIFTALLLPWLVYATLTFGSPLPNTFFAKTGDLAANVFVDELGPQMAGLFAFSRVDALQGYIVLAVIIIILVWGWLVTKDIFIRLTVTWAALYLGAYSLLGIRHAFHWYYYPVIPAILLSMVSTMRWLKVRLEKMSRDNFFVRQSPFILIILPMLTLAIMGTVSLNRQYESLASLGGRNIVYPLAANWVCAHSEPGASILTPEIGIIGWNCNRKIIDPYGLVTPEMIPYIRDGNQFNGEVLFHPDFIIIPNVELDEARPTVPGTGILQDVYVPVQIFTDDRYPYQLIIFSKTQ